MNVHVSTGERAGRDMLKTEPFGSVRKELDRFFGEFPRNFRIPDIFTGNEFEFVPDMDVLDTEKKIVLTLELPGVAEKEIEVTAIGDMLKVTGEKKSDFERKEGDFYRRERGFGAFARTLTLPFEIEPAKVEAKFEKGILTLTIPKPAEAVKQPAKIAVKA